MNVTRWFYRSWILAFFLAFPGCSSAPQTLSDLLNPKIRLSTELQLDQKDVWVRLEKSGYLKDPAIQALLSQAYNEYLYDLGLGSEPSRLAAEENLSHILRMTKITLDHENEIQKIGVDVGALVTGIALSDFGKSERMIAVTVAEKVKSGEWKSGDPENFFRGFMEHEERGLALLSQRWKELGLSESRRKKIEDTVRFHCGPSTEGVWWRKNWDRLFPQHPYGMVQGLEGLVHVVLDRADQGSIYLVQNRHGAWVLEGGVKKTMLEIQSRRAPALADVVRASFVVNPKYTQMQFNDLKERALKKRAESKKDWIIALKSPFLKKEISKVDDTVKYSESGIVEIESAQVRVAGKQVTSVDEFFEALRRELLAQAAAE